MFYLEIVIFWLCDFRAVRFRDVIFVKKVTYLWDVLIMKVVAGAIKTMVFDVFWKLANYPILYLDRNPNGCNSHRSRPANRADSSSNHMDGHGLFLTHQNWGYLMGEPLDPTFTNTSQQDIQRVQTITPTPKRRHKSIIVGRYREICSKLKNTPILSLNVGF